AEAAAGIAHTAALERWVGSGCREQRRNTRASPERSDVVGRAVGVGTLEPITRDDGVDQSRVASRDRVVAEPDALDRIRTDVGEEHVGAVDQIEGVLASGLGL